MKREKLSYYKTLRNKEISIFSLSDRRKEPNKKMSTIATQSIDLNHLLEVMRRAADRERQCKRKRALSRDPHSLLKPQLQRNEKLTPNNNVRVARGVAQSISRFSSASTTLFN